VAGAWYHRRVPDTPPSLSVLQVLPSLESGGVERGTVEIAAAIAKAGGRALVASAGGRLVAAVEFAGGRHVTLPLASKNPWRIWDNARLLATLIRAERIGIVHARSRAPAWSAWLAARRTGARFITTYHAPYSEGSPAKRRYNSVMARGELVIAISRTIAALVAARYGIAPARIRTIPRGIDPLVFDPTGVAADRVLRLAAAWRIGDAQEVILLPGRLTRWKGQAVLIEALSRLARRDVVVVLVGADRGRRRYVRELTRLAERLGVADRVRMVGLCDDMPAALMLAAVVVNPSQQPEGFGRVVIEAQAMARPVIATGHGGAAETIAHGVTGWLVPPGEALTLAEALDHVLALTPSARAAFGAQARAAVVANYTVAAMQAATLAAYRELLPA